MYSDLVLTRCAIGRDRLDLHRHATFRCALARLVRSLFAVFGYRDRH
ncbi:hypothetical protein C8N35_108137 [Breoghania corrubedonensis]|uniref:Uncharacterized protein n=1 Tax=Breoghania corrubedonensis TaxID=665038 RepID=A0A2T5V5S2_9HYPH|nr:hypothetical protein [Breoghania corrubedonensis]PTW59100.1 hypothetical protein C8N35_108137 [Breoghania corrubedonensis]